MTLGQTCPECKERPAIRTDGLCAGCGHDEDVRWKRVNDWLRRLFDKETA